MCPWGAGLPPLSPEQGPQTDSEHSSNDDPMKVAAGEQSPSSAGSWRLCGTFAFRGLDPHDHQGWETWALPTGDSGHAALDRSSSL